METRFLKQYAGTPFTVECSTVKNKPGTWDSIRVSIYKNKNIIGEYIRNYSVGGIETFYPFLVDNNWFALYSANYTATRIVKLTDDSIEDWCGEDPSPNGFCPAEFYVPKYNEFKSSDIEYYTVDAEYKNINDFIDEQTTAEFIDSRYCNFAFVSGCHWGDDSYRKLKYIDLSNINNKQITVEDRFGYWQLPNNLSLKECINMGNWEPNHHWIGLTRIEHVNLKTDERC